MLGVPGILSAQVATASTVVVHGVVFDSVMSRPLPGALVQLARIEHEGGPWSVRADSVGRYRLSGVRAGRYLIGFYHEALNVLDLDTPTRVVDLGADSLVTADLAIPSAGTVRSMRCGDQPLRADSGVLVGFVRDAIGKRAVSGASLRLEWGAIVLDSGNARAVVQSETVTMDADGRYLVCRLPADVPLQLAIRAPEYQTVAGRVATIPSNGIGRLDAFLVDSARTHGDAMVRGHVSRVAGMPVTSGQVVIAAIDRVAVVRDGAYVLADLPAGSWVAEARVIGSDPVVKLVEATDSAAAETDFEISEQTQRLDAVTIVGKMDRNTQVLEDILKRSRYGAGSYFLPGNIHLRMAMYISDVMQNARGFRIKSDGEIVGRQTATSLQGVICGKPAVFLDDEYLPNGFDVLDRLVPIGQVLAMETYPDIMFAPVRFQTGFGTPDPMKPSSRARPCAVIAVWTKRKF